MKNIQKQLLFGGDLKLRGGNFPLKGPEKNTVHERHSC